MQYTNLLVIRYKSIMIFKQWYSQILSLIPYQVEIITLEFYNQYTYNITMSCDDRFFSSLQSILFRTFELSVLKMSIYNNKWREKIIWVDEIK